MISLMSKAPDEVEDVEMESSFSSEWYIISVTTLGFLRSVLLCLV